MTRKRLSDAEREARRRADRDRLEQAARALLTSDGWRRWVNVRATHGLSRYSFGNQLLISLQRPEATFVAGFRAFLDLGRCVRKGERAIRILAPMTLRTATTGNKPGGDDDEQRRTVFRSVAVFDVAQTDPLPGRDPVPLEPPRQPISGDSHRHLLGPLSALASELGYQIRHAPAEGTADGWCDTKRKEIVVNSALPANGQVRVAVHEIAHALGVCYREYGRETAEVLVDTVTYVVCSSVGLDVSGESVSYVAGWGEEGALDAVREYAETIDRLARRMEDALTAHGSGEAEVAADAA